MIDISVLIPVYNGIKYIQRGLDSICRQSLKTIEIIVVDDGSSDGSGTMLDEYAQKDSRIIVIHQQNAGVGTARNVAIEHSHGEYLYFFDIDDWVEPNMLKSVLSAVRKNDVQLAIFGFKVLDGAHEEDIVLPDKYLLSSSAIAEKYVDDILSVRHGSGFLWNKLYRRDIICQHHIKFNHFKVQEDELFNINYMKYVNSLVLMPDVFYMYYISNVGNSRSRYLPNMHNIIMTVHQAFLDLQKSMQILDSRFNEFVNRRTFSAIMQWVTFHLFHPDCPWTLEERRNIVRSITNSPFWKEINYPIGWEQRLYVSALTHGDIRLLSIYVHFFMYLRNIKKTILHA